MNNLGKSSWRVGRSDFVVALLFALLFPCSLVHAAPPTEYEVKAAFVHNIAQFVKWPAAPRAGDKLRLCILGQSPFTKAAGSLAGEQIGDWVWEVQGVDSRADLRECRVLLIAASESGNLRRVLQGLNGSAVLTVGDSDGYAEQGVMINFYLDQNQNKVRIEINVDAAQRAGLNIGSQLLKLARIVQSAGRIK